MLLELQVGVDELEKSLKQYDVSLKEDQNLLESFETGLLFYIDGLVREMAIANKVTAVDPDKKRAGFGVREQDEEDEVHPLLEDRNTGRRKPHLLQRGDRRPCPATQRPREEKTKWRKGAH